MNMFTKVSGKGQVVLPKAMRDLKGWPAGTDLEAIDVEDGVLLRPTRPTKGLTLEEAEGRLRKLYVHKGPPVSLDQMKTDAAEEAAERYRRAS
jgi:AbrB family looped-hinge helix DNA binding protein